MKPVRARKTVIARALYSIGRGYHTTRKSEPVFRSRPSALFLVLHPKHSYNFFVLAPAAAGGAAAATVCCSAKEDYPPALFSSRLVKPMVAHLDIWLKNEGRKRSAYPAAALMLKVW